MNQYYMSIYDILDKDVILEAKLASPLEDLERHEELRRKMKAAEASREKEFTRIRDEIAELKGKLQDRQTSLEAFWQMITQHLLLR